MGGKSLTEMWNDRLRFRRSTILVVEDDPVTRQLLSRSLRPTYRILEAAGEEEAVRIAAQHLRNIDLLLSEARLPHLFGWELLELLALDYPKLKAVYISKSLDPETKSRTHRQKVLLLEQPFRSSYVRDAVREGLENRQSKRVGMKWTFPFLLLRLRSYFRRSSWMHRAAS